jgi:hypothetical protein
MALAQYAGLDVLRARLCHPSRGAWWGELELDTQTAPSGKNDLVVQGGFTLTGTVVRGGPFIGSTTVRVSGGAGGTTTRLEAAAYENAQLQDVLAAIASGAGETVSSSVAGDVAGVQLPYWTISGQPAARALDLLADMAGQLLGAAINWRILSDGSLWMGSESWPSQQLPLGSDVLWQFPELGKYVLGVEAPSILPGVALSDVGINVVAVDHWLEADQVRTWLWA